VYDRHVFLGLKGKTNNLKDITSVPTAVLRDAPPDKILKSRNFKSLHPVTRTSQIPKMLLTFRAKLWYDSFAIISHTLKMNNIPIDKFEVFENDIKVKQHIGLSKDLGSLHKKMQKTFLQIKKDGTYQKILNKYQYTNTK
jgi:hypothetical protein